MYKGNEGEGGVKREEAGRKRRVLHSKEVHGKQAPTMEMWERTEQRYCWEGSWGPWAGLRRMQPASTATPQR